MRLILFTRYPEPGKAKTRLIPALGPEGAALLQQQLTERTLTMARQLEQSRDASIEVRYAGGSDGLFRRWLGRGLLFKHQGDGNLGDRMARARRKASEIGLRPAFLESLDDIDRPEDLHLLKT